MGIKVQFNETGNQINVGVKNSSVLLKGENGATFTPEVSQEGILSWTNDKLLENPNPINIKGPIGPAGPKGESGADGAQGPKGARGEKGEKGDKGDKGDPGRDGKDGINGQDGINGKDGISLTHHWQGSTLYVTSASGTSSANLKGEPGEQGPQGVQGLQGVKGDKGDKGEQGQKGDKGDPGETGPRGEQGPTGSSGSPGKDGVDGAPGKDGKDGKDGVDGYTPQRGVDYWTEADQKAINAHIAEEVAALGAHSTIVTTAKGETILATDSAKAKLRGLKLYGKSTQDGTPSPESPVEIVSAGQDGDIVVTIDGETPQTLTALTPGGLGEGDYIDFAGRVQLPSRGKLVLNGAERYDMHVTPYNIKQIWLYHNGDNKFTANGVSLCGAYCTHFKEVTPNDAYLGTKEGLSVDYNTSRFRFNYAELIDNMTSVDEWKAYVKGQYDAGTPIIIDYPLANPETIPLTKEDLAQFAALQTYYPTTTILNDEGVGMEVSYVADTKNYIDKKINELAAAIVAKA